MQKYLVISYDLDEQQSFWDFVEAASPDDARATIDEIRDYAIAVDALTLDDLRACTAALDAHTSESIRESLVKLRAAHDAAYNEGIPQEDR